jgi:hypothetical protein
MREERVGGGKEGCCATCSPAPVPGAKMISDWAWAGRAQRSAPGKPKAAANLAVGRIAVDLSPSGMEMEGIFTGS